MKSIKALVLQGMLRFRYLPVTSYFTSFPRPDGPPYASASGDDPDRILLCGTDVVNGWGVRHHDLALPGHLARSLSELTGRGASVVVAADPRMIGINALPPLLNAESLSTFDAVVIITGLFDAAFLTSAKTWRHQMTALITNLELRTRPSASIVVVGIPPISGIVSFSVRPHGVIDSHAAHLNRITEQLYSSSDRVRFLPMNELKARQPGAGVSGPSEQFGRLAREQAAILAPLLRAHNPIAENSPARPSPPYDGISGH